MKIYNDLRKFYQKVKNIENIINTKLVVNKYDYLAMITNEKGIEKEGGRKEEIVISLTTYGHRIHEVYLTVESLLHQTIKPNRIILWLDYSFKDLNIPIILKRQIDRGLEIQYCEDIRSYTKLVPTLKLCPNAVIVSVDDDMIYTPDFLEHLVNGYKKNPSKIYFYRGHKIVLDSKGNVMPYSDWVKTGAEDSSVFNVPTGVCGVLYPPKCFHKDVINQEVFLDICPYADDIWFKAMSLLNKIECVKVEVGKDVNDKFTYVNTAESYSLSNINNLQGMNDVQIQDVFKRYKIKTILEEVIIHNKE